MGAYFEKVSRFADVDLPLPTRSTADSAGYDFVVAEDIVLPPYEHVTTKIKDKLFENGRMKEDYFGFLKPLTLDEMAAATKELKVKIPLVSTGMKCHLERGQYLEISVRSSTPLKHWIILGNSVGIIDADYYNNPDNPAIVWYLQYVYFLPLYFVTVIFGVAQYFISYLFVSRSNCVRNSIIILIMGELVLFAFPTLLGSFVDESCNPYTFIAYTGASPALPIINIVEVFNPAIRSGENYFEMGEDMGGFALFMFIFNYLIFIGMTVLGIVAFTKEKDPSGEFAGKSLTKKPFQEIIFHAGFALFGTFISSMMIRSNIISYLLFLVFFLAAYYPLYGTLIRNFKLKPWQILVMAGVVLFMVTVSASNNAVRNYYDGIY